MSGHKLTITLFAAAAVVTAAGQLWGGGASAVVVEKTVAAATGVEQARRPVRVAIERDSAGEWVRAVVNLLTDRNFGRHFSEAQARFRWAPVVPEVVLHDDSALSGGGTLTGRNPKVGVLWIEANVSKVGRGVNGAWVATEVTIVMPERDVRGNEVYPALLRALRRQLRPEVWQHKEDPNGLRQFWRRGKSRFVINVEKGQFSGAHFEEPGPGPWVIVNAGEEEGDS